MLVGDSLGMTVQGHDSRYRLPLLISPTTLPPCVAARKLPSVSRPAIYGVCHAGTSLENAATVMRAGANMVKIEGGSGW